MSVEPSSQVWQRITLVLDESLENLIITQALRLGVESYICSYCSGKPLHHALHAPSGLSGLVRIEFLAQPAEAKAVAEYIRQLQQRNYPVTALVDVVAALTPVEVRHPSGHLA